MRIRWLDSLRGFAACSIAFFWHYRHFGSGCEKGWLDFGFAPGHGTWPFSLLYAWSCYGVDFFFVLSGLVFSLVYWDRVASRADIVPLEFFRRRFARLYPMHIGTFLLIAPMIWGFWFFAHRFPLYDGGSSNNGHDVLYNVLFIQGGVYRMYSGYNAPSWSLTIEELMYITFFTVAWVWGYWLPRLMPWLLGAAMAAAGWWYLEGGDVRVTGLFANGEVGRGVLGFGIGMLAYQLMRVGCWVVLPVAVAAWSIYSHVIPLVAADLIFAAALIGLWWCRPLQWLLELRPLVAVGDCSLTIYLMHLPIQTALICAWTAAGHPIPLSAIWFWLLYAGLVLTASYFINDRYEQPMRRWLRGESYV